MFTFSQFLVENSRIKGWMSPMGHPFEFSGEHYITHHPTIAKKMKPYVDSVFDNDEDPTTPITQAQKRGYTRYAKEGDIHMIHFDKDAPTGRQSALHTLKHLDPKEPTYIVVRDRPYKYGKTRINRERLDKHEYTFTKASDAARHIRNG